MSEQAPSEKTLPEKSVLFIDDRQSDLPIPDEQRNVRVLFGLNILLADSEQPVESGLRLLQDKPEIVAVVTDRCGQADFGHIAQMRKLRPYIPIVLLSGAHLTPAERNKAMAAGADECVTKGSDWRTSFLHFVADDRRAADRRFRMELPRMLDDPALWGSWVAFTREGRVTEVTEGEDDLQLIRECERRGLAGRFTVGRVVPDTECEYSQAWYEVSG
jgi:CheY-like chemotaxis protein